MIIPTRQRPTKSPNGQHAHLLETGDTWNHWAVELVQEIGRRATLITGEPREFIFLFQLLSIALQSGNTVAFLNTFDSD